MRLLNFVSTWILVPTITYPTLTVRIYYPLGEVGHVVPARACSFLFFFIVSPRLLFLFEGTFFLFLRPAVRVLSCTFVFFSFALFLSFA